MTTTAAPRHTPSGTSTGSNGSTGSSAKPTAEQRLCDGLIALLHGGLNPWRKPWNPSRCGQHRNLLTGRPYQGSNPALLELQLMLRSSDLPLWIGFHQAAAQGWYPRKGSHGCLIYRPLLLPINTNSNTTTNSNSNSNSKSNTANNTNAHTASSSGDSTAAAVQPSENNTGDSSSAGTPLLLRFRPALVFHAADLHDAPPSRRPRHHQPIAAAIAAATAAAPTTPLPQRLATAERHLSAWPVPLLCSGDRAFYIPSRDQIHLPARPLFHSHEAFLATWAHEQIHSTGHPSRLNRPGVRCPQHPSSDAYAREELIAELGAFLLCHRLAIGSDTTNHAAYLQHWIALLGQGPRLLSSVLAEASRAANLICPETTTTTEPLTTPSPAERPADTPCGDTGADH